MQSQLGAAPVVLNNAFHEAVRHSSHAESVVWLPHVDCCQLCAVWCRWLDGISETPFTHCRAVDLPCTFALDCRWHVFGFDR